MSMAEVQAALWGLTHSTMSNNLLEDIQTAGDRYRLIFFYEYTSLLLRAVYLLHNEKAAK